MSLEQLVDIFAAANQLPIEITEVQERVIALGVQDEIIFRPVDGDPRKCCGVYYQFVRHDGAYSAPTLVSLIIYTCNVTTEWQRVICAKEMIHVMDHQAGKTRTESDLQGLLEKLLGPLATEDFGLADLMAGIDKLAIYQCLAFLFPPLARTEALEEIRAGRKTVDDIAAWSALPLPLVQVVLSDAWPEMSKMLVTA